MAVHAPPTGTLTMLFSDIEGSTALLTRLGAQEYAQVLTAQRQIVRQAIADFGGHELGTEGDSHFVVFDSARDAVCCAVQAQRELVAHGWPDAAEVRVRMGLHTGEPVRHEDGYVGIAVHRAARVAGAAHGGQVLLTGTTWALVDGSLPAGVTAEDVGEHRLKDLAAAERLHRLVIAGVPVVSTPPRGLGTTAGLPQPNTPLVGRVDELALVDRFLADGHRLLTLVGPGGVGKTRLAVEAALRTASRFPGGVHFVDLSAATDAELAWSKLAQALPGSGEDDGPRHAVGRYAGDRVCLLLLDNVEQVRGAGELVAELLDLANKGAVLVTSRHPVRLLQEQQVPVDPLPVPAAEAVGTSGVESSPAVQLFLQHARRARPGLRLSDSDLADVARVCRALDGLPLALEIAAVRLRLLSPRRLLSGLGGGLSLVAREIDRPARQRSLRDTITWSYDLLDPAAQRVLRVLAVAPGGADLGTVEALTADDTPGSQHAADPLDVLAELVDASLVRTAEGPDGEPRVRLLHVVREFAVEALTAAGEADRAHRRLAERMADLAVDLGAAAHGTTQLQALDRLQAERDNLREALDWSLAPQGATPAADRVALGLRTAVALGTYWQHHGQAEGRGWLERAVALADTTDTADAADTAAAPERRTAALEALQSLAGILYRQGETAAALRALERTLPAWRELGRDDLLTGGLARLGLCLRVVGDIEAARSALEESVEVAHRIGDPALTAGALTDLGILETDAGDPDRAAELFTEAIAVEESVGDVWGPAVSRANLAVALLETSRGDQAFDALTRVVPVLPQLDDVELTIVVLEGLAAALVQLGHDDRAARATGAARRLRDEAGMPMPERDRQEVDRAVAPGRARLGERGWLDAVAAGRTLSWQQALDDAVGHQRA